MTRSSSKRFICPTTESSSRICSVGKPSFIQSFIACSSKTAHSATTRSARHWSPYR
nr:MAG TPA: hypothetical protein [Caudoviricetes sp.]